MENVKFISNNKDLLRKVISLDKAREAKCQITGTKTLEEEYRNYYLEQKENNKNFIEMLDYIEFHLGMDYEFYIENTYTMDNTFSSLEDLLAILYSNELLLEDAYSIRYNKQMREYTFNISTMEYKLGII